MFVASNLIGSTIQITTLPLPVLSALQASGLVFNTAFATLLLKEPFTRYSAIGTIGTCAGAALIATFGAIGENAHNLQQLLQLLRERPFILWMAGTLLVAALTVIGAHMLKIYSSHRHIVRHWFDKHERPRSASSSSSHTNAHIKRQFTSLLPRPMQLRLARLRVIQGLAYGLISGILSAHSLLVAKSAVELIVRTVVDKHNQFNQFQSWLILLALVFFALTQLYYLHLGLRLCSTSVLYPFVFCIYNVIAILDGLIYFKQGSRLSRLDAGLVALGTIILLAGVLALSWRLDHSISEEAPHPEARSPRTPQTPGSGMGTFNSPEIGNVSPTGRRGSASDERTSLLRRHSLTRTVEFQVNLPQTDTRDIWAALDDQEDDNGDFIASLPHSPPPFVKVPKRRSKSPSLQAVSSTSENSDDGNVGRSGTKKPRRSSMKGSRSASAGQAERQEESQVSVTQRRRGNTVHFDISAPSRFNLAGNSRTKTADDEETYSQNKENG